MPPKTDRLGFLCSCKRYYHTVLDHEKHRRMVNAGDGEHTLDVASARTRRATATRDHDDDDDDVENDDVAGSRGVGDGSSQPPAKRRAPNRMFVLCALVRCALNRALRSRRGRRRRTRGSRCGADASRRGHAGCCSCGRVGASDCCSTHGRGEQERSGLVRARSSRSVERPSRPGHESPREAGVVQPVRLCRWNLHGEFVFACA